MFTIVLICRAVRAVKMYRLVKTLLVVFVVIFFTLRVLVIYQRKSKEMDDTAINCATSVLTKISKIISLLPGTDIDNISAHNFQYFFSNSCNKIDKLTFTVDSDVSFIEFCSSEIDDFEKKKLNGLNESLNIHNGRINELKIKYKLLSDEVSSD